MFLLRAATATFLIWNCLRSIVDSSALRIDTPSCIPDRHHGRKDAAIFSDWFFDPFLIPILRRGLQTYAETERLLTDRIAHRSCDHLDHCCHCHSELAA